MRKVRLNINLTLKACEELDKRAEQTGLSRSVIIDNLIQGLLEHSTNTILEHNPNTLTKEAFMEGINKVIESNTKDRNTLYRDLKEVINDLQIMGKPTNKVGEIIEEAILAE